MQCDPGRLLGKFVFGGAPTLIDDEESIILSCGHTAEFRFLSSLLCKLCRWSTATGVLWGSWLFAHAIPVARSGETLLIPHVVHPSLMVQDKNLCICNSPPPKKKSQVTFFYPCTDKCLITNSHSRQEYATPFNNCLLI